MSPSQYVSLVTGPRTHSLLPNSSPAIATNLSLADKAREIRSIAQDNPSAVEAVWAKGYGFLGAVKAYHAARLTLEYNPDISHLSALNATLKFVQQNLQFGRLAPEDFKDPLALHRQLVAPAQDSVSIRRTIDPWSLEAFNWPSDSESK